MTDFPQLKLKILPTFPANVIGGQGVAVTKNNGAYVISINHAAFLPAVPVADPLNQNVVTYNIITQQYALTSVTSLLNTPTPTIGGIQQNSQSANYTTVLADAEKHIFHPSADVTARTWTIDSNANVAYPIGTPITFVNQNGAGVITIAITADTLRLAGAGSTGSRTLAANGVCTALKVTATEWIISGTGLT